MGPVLAQEGVKQKPTNHFFTKERNDENQPNNPTSDRNCHPGQPVSGSRCGRWTIQIFKIFQSGSAKVGSSTDGLQANGPFPGEPGTVILCDPRPFQFSPTTANQEYKVILGQPRQCSPFKRSQATAADQQVILGQPRQCSQATAADQQVILGQPRQRSQATANTNQFRAKRLGTTAVNAELALILDDPRPGGRAIKKREYKVSCWHTWQFNTSQFSPQRSSRPPCQPGGRCEGNYRAPAW